MKNHNYLSRLVVVLTSITALILLTGCEAYLNFELGRLKFLIYFTVITGVIGVIWIIFKGNE